MQEINSNSYRTVSGSGVPGPEEQRGGCLSDNRNNHERTNLMELDDNKNALKGGHGAYSRSSVRDIYETGTDLGGDAGAGGNPTFVEIPLSGDQAGGNIQITGFQMSMGKDEAVKSPEHTTQAKGIKVPDDGTGFGSAEIAIQAGGINLLVYRGVQEATLRTVMKVVMEHA